MNIKRGLFRIWVVLTLLYLVAVGSFAWDAIASQQAYLATLPVLSFTPIDVKCDTVRGKEGTDYWVPKTGAACFYADVKRFRELFPEYNDLSDDEIIAKTDAVFGLPPPTNPIHELIKFYLLAAILPPLGFLALGSLIYWALAGFARTPKPEN